MKRFFMKFVSIKFWLAIYLCFLLWQEITKIKPDSTIVSILIGAILLCLGIREYSKNIWLKNGINDSTKSVPSGPDGHYPRGPGG